MKKVTLLNKFHNTKYVVVIKDEDSLDMAWGVILILQYRANSGNVTAKRKLHKIWKKLCGNKECKCCWDSVSEIPYF